MSKKGEIIELSPLDANFISLPAFWFFEGSLDFQKLKISLDETIEDIPVLSSVIKESKEGHYYIETVSPSNVVFEEKIVEDEKVFNLFKMKKDKTLATEEGAYLSKYFESVKGDPTNPFKPILNVPCCRITLISIKKAKKSIICVSINHALGDAYSLVKFMTKWSKRTKSDLKFKYQRPDVFLLSKEQEEKFDIEKVDSKIVNRTLMYHPKRYQESKKEEIGLKFYTDLVYRMIQFDKEKAEKLKESVKKDLGNDFIFSRHDCVSAMLYKFHAAHIGSYDDQIIPFFMIVDLRSRMKKLVGESFFGNGVFLPSFTMTRKEILTSKLSVIVKKIRNLINSVDFDTVRVGVNCLRKFASTTMTHFRITDLCIDNWGLLDKEYPEFEGTKCVRSELNIPTTKMGVTFMMFSRIKDGNFNFISTFNEKKYEMIKDYDFTSLEDIEKISKL